MFRKIILLVITSAFSYSVIAGVGSTLGTFTIINTLLNGSVPGDGVKDPDQAATATELQKEIDVIMARNDLPILTREHQRMVLVEKFRRLSAIGIFPRYSAQVPDDERLLTIESVGFKNPPPEEVEPAVGDPEPGAFLFSEDAGKKVFVDFKGSPGVRSGIAKVLAESGTSLVDNAKDAEVHYLFDGEFYIPKTLNHDEFEISASVVLEGKTFTVPSDHFFVLPGTPSDHDHYRQYALMIVTRHAAGAPDETSVTWVSGRGSVVQAADMLDMALADLMKKCGLAVRISNGRVFNVTLR